MRHVLVLGLLATTLAAGNAHATDAASQRVRALIGSTEARSPSVKPHLLRMAQQLDAAGTGELTAEHRAPNVRTSTFVRAHDGVTSEHTVSALAITNREDGAVTEIISSSHRMPNRTEGVAASLGRTRIESVHTVVQSGADGHLIDSHRIVEKVRLGGLLRTTTEHRAETLRDANDFPIAHRVFVDKTTYRLGRSKRALTVDRMPQPE